MASSTWLSAFVVSSPLPTPTSLQPARPKCLSPKYLSPKYLASSSSAFNALTFRAPRAVVMTMTASSNKTPSSVPQDVGASNPDGYEVRTTKNRGEGVFATRAFRRGEIVVQGVIIAELPANHSHATQVAIDRFVQHGGLNSIVNHSCDPNCGIKLNTTGANDIVAMRRIQIGEEIAFDYAMRNYSIQHFPKQCGCGASACRKTITGYKDLPSSFKKKYEGFIAPYLMELDARVQRERK